MTVVEQEKLTKILEKCKRNQNKPDLHSFKARIKDGWAFVDYSCCFNVLTEKFDTQERELYCLNLSETLELLKELGIDENSIE